MLRLAPFFARIVSKAPSMVFAVGVGSALLGSVAVGAVVGPIGVTVALALAVLVGVAAGRVLHNEEDRAMRRSRELDAILGGTAPKEPASEPELEVEEGTKSGEAWLAEWLTPPPPTVG